MPKGKPQLFDLNVEKILDHWGVPEAAREVIANALDEQALSGTAQPQIVKRRDGWHITDSGRGLRYQHLTQNENPEKRRRSDLVVGKFGVGLKDALATFDRRGIEVRIRSPHGDITLQRAAKSNFADVKTLHAAITPPSEPRRRGTDFTLGGLSDADMAAARDYFLRFANDKGLERTELGVILERLRDPLPVRPLLVCRVQDPLAATVGQEPRAGVLAERLDLGIEQGFELRSVGPPVPLHEDSRVGSVPPDRGDTRDREVDVVSLRHFSPATNVTQVTDGGER